MSAVITNPITGDTLQVSTVNQVYNLIYRVAEAVIDGAKIDFKYPDLNRSISEWGAILASARLPATESRSVNKNITSKGAAAYPSPSVLYYQTWTEKVYPADIRRIDADKVVSGEMEFEAFLAKVINANIEGYRKDVNAGMKAAFGYTASSTPANYAEIIISTATSTAPTVSTNAKSILGAAGQYEVLSSATFADVYKELQKITKDMTFDNSTYSGSFVCGASVDDLMIIMPTDFTAAASVDFMAKLYNMEQAAKLPKIVETDGLAWNYTDAQSASHTKCVILIQDKKFLSHIERYRAVDSGYDRDRKAQFSDLHIEDAIAINPLYKAYAIVFDLPST